MKIADSQQSVCLQCVVYPRSIEGAGFLEHVQRPLKIFGIAQIKIRRVDTRERLQSLVHGNVTTGQRILIRFVGEILLGFVREQVLDQLDSTVLILA